MHGGHTADVVFGGFCRDRRRRNRGQCLRSQPLFRKIGETCSWIDRMQPRATEMTTISIRISDERFLRLKELAVEANLAPEELVRCLVEEWLSRRQGDFAMAAKHVLAKNAELYRRLAE